MNKKTRTNRYNKLPGDAEHLAQNSITKDLEQKKKKHQLNPGGKSNRPTVLNVCIKLTDFVML